MAAFKDIAELALINAKEIAAAGLRKVPLLAAGAGESLAKKEVKKLTKSGGLGAAEDRQTSEVRNPLTTTSPEPAVGTDRSALLQYSPQATGDKLVRGAADKWRSDLKVNSGQVEHAWNPVETVAEAAVTGGASIPIRLGNFLLSGALETANVAAKDVIKTLNPLGATPAYASGGMDATPQQATGEVKWTPEESRATYSPENATLIRDTAAKQAKTRQDEESQIATGFRP
jgi:hypothetical protein